MWGTFFRKFSILFLIAIYFIDVYGGKEAEFFTPAPRHKKFKKHYRMDVCPLFSDKIRDRIAIEKKRSPVAIYLATYISPLYHCKVTPRIALIFSHILDIVDGCSSDGKPLKTNHNMTSIKHRATKIAIECISSYAYKQMLLQKFLVKDPFKE